MLVCVSDERRACHCCNHDKDCDQERCPHVVLLYCTGSWLGVRGVVWSGVHWGMGAWDDQAPCFRQHLTINPPTQHCHWLQHCNLLTRDDATSAIIRVNIWVKVEWPHPTHQPHLMAVTIVSMVHLTQGKGIGKVLVATAKINIRNDHPLHTERGNYDQDTIFNHGPILCP